MSTIKFYQVDYSDTNLGPCRKHFATKREALQGAKLARAEADLDVEVWLCIMPTDKASILEALNNSSNLGSEGLTGLPGDRSLVATFAPQHDDND